MTDSTPGATNPASPATALADELLDAYLDDQPLWATLSGIRNRDDRLADLSAEAEERSLRRLDDIVARARALDPADPQDRLTRDVVVTSGSGTREQVAARAVEFTVTDLFNAPASILLNFVNEAGLAEPEQAEAYLRRLREIPRYLDTAAERQRAGTAAGRTGVRRLVAAAIGQVDRYLATPVAADTFAKPSPPAGWDGADAWRERLDRVLAEEVRPAFARYRDAIEADVLPHGRPDEQPGLTYLPGGDEIYAMAARVHTTTDRTPEDLHRTGLDIIARLAEEYAEVGSRVFGTSDPAEVFDRIRTDPSLRYDTADELLADAERAIRKAEAAAPQWFGRLPQQACRVVPVPADLAPGLPFAYYMAPALDGTREGTYFINTYQPGERLRSSAEAVAYHEAVPGHHFQMTIAVELTNLPMLRRLSDFTAYGEGWGLYSERLAEEMGLYADDVQRLGMLTADSMRAARLVVDTGLHAMGWSRERAVSYCADNTPMARIEIETEIDRYISDPGQALAYMVGRLEIQKIRADAERALGERFDVRTFHDLVLGVGPLPLGTLGTVVAEWAAAGGESPLLPART